MESNAIISECRIGTSGAGTEIYPRRAYFTWSDGHKEDYDLPGLLARVKRLETEGRAVPQEYADALGKLRNRSQGDVVEHDGQRWQVLTVNDTAGKCSSYTLVSTRDGRTTREVPAEELDGPPPSTTRTE